MHILFASGTKGHFMCLSGLQDQSIKKKCPVPTTLAPVLHPLRGFLGYPAPGLVQDFENQSVLLLLH